ncbi:MAG: HD domain-containing protein [Oscillospiraceae bacterium]|nr:HD domain-containing protein [Oscillospiraceae bacterium]
MKIIRKWLVPLLLAVSLLQGVSLSSAGAVNSADEMRRSNYLADIFNEERGLPTGEANTVVLGQDGYLWFGSYGGLVRYDGSTMTDFSNHFENCAIRTLYSASDGSLYIGTNGASAYVLQNDVFTHLQAEDDHSFLIIRGITEDRNGTIYLASHSGVAKVEDGKLIPYSYEEMEGAGFQSIAVDKEGNIWAMTLDSSLCVFNDSEFLAEITSEELFSGATIAEVSCNRSGVLYIGSSDGQILRLISDERTVQGQPGTYIQKHFLAEGVGAITHIKPVRDSTILVSALNGFGYLDEAGDFHPVSTNSDNNLSANCAELDKEGNYWVASLNYGIIRYSVGCFDSCNDNSSLGEHSINAVVHTAERFYVATDLGLMVFDENWIQIDEEICELFDGIRVRGLTVDLDGRIWIASYSEHGAVCYDPSTGETKDFGPEQGLRSDKVRVVYSLSDGRILLGTQTGFCLVENDRITETYPGEEGATMTAILCAMELNGEIYVGSDGDGIYKLTANGLLNMSFDMGLADGVILRMVPDCDGSGNFFVCGGDKLYYYEQGKFRLLSNVKTGSGSLFGLYDVNGTIWLLQNAGVLAANKEDLLAGEDVYTAVYGIECGLCGSLKANTWAWQEGNHLLYLPTRSGISRFYFHGPEVPLPKAILNSVTIDDRTIPHPAELTIPSDARRVTFDISQLLFSDTCEFLLGYQLEGFDTAETQTLDKHTVISYTNLNGGEYKLKLRVIDPMTDGSSPVHEISIVKQKLLREESWFYFVCALAVALLIAGFVSFYLKHKTKMLLKRQEEQRRYIEEITKVFSQCVDLRDHYTNGHSARVAKYTALLAEKLGKSPKEVNDMYQIALLHDVGKISIPDAVLNKPGRLNDEEYSLMKSHSQRGFEVLQNIDVAPELAVGARFHHERYDGKGYPCGLKGDEIPEVAQIIAVADTFDAMFSTRPYRKKMELSAVVAEIKRCSGTQLSPRVVEAFLKLVEEGTIYEDMPVEKI